MWFLVTISIKLENGRAFYLIQITDHYDNCDGMDLV